MRPGPRNLITDVAGLRVGNADDLALKSGTTVVVAEAPFVASVAVMGGAPGTRETDLLAPDKTAPGVDALVLSGGSAFGLAAAQGVMDALHEQGRGFAVLSARVPIVPAAILFDLLNGGHKGWGVNPYPALGRQALANAGESFALGSAGAGAGAQTAQHKGGLGSASVVLPGGVSGGALEAGNPMGSVTTPSGRPPSRWARNSAGWGLIPRAASSRCPTAASWRPWQAWAIPPSPWWPPMPSLTRHRRTGWRWPRMTASGGRSIPPIRPWMAIWSLPPPPGTDA